MTDKLHIHASGATSSELTPPYHLTTGFGEKVTALRFGHGNTKHEASTTILAEANWLKAFHTRDLPFFRDRMGHAKEHILKEMHGNFDTGPGGNWGAVGWCVDIMPFVQAYDPEFYNAIVGIAKHPGERKGACPCSRCEAKPKVVEPSASWINVGQLAAGTITGWADLPKAVDVKITHQCSKCSRIYLPGYRWCCNRCEEHCTCL